jgi:hypothetical protein
MLPAGSSESEASSDVCEEKPRRSGAPCIRPIFTGSRIAAPQYQHERRRHGSALGATGLRRVGRPEGDPLPRRTLGPKGSISKSACSEELSGWIWICPVCTHEALRCRIRSAVTITISRPGNATKSRMVRAFSWRCPSCCWHRSMTESGRRQVGHHTALRKKVHSRTGPWRPRTSSHRPRLG